MQMITLTSWKRNRIGSISLAHFTILGEGFIKINFYGESKGNLGEKSFGGLFRENQANTRLIYVDSCGIESNNGAKFVAKRQDI